MKFNKKVIKDNIKLSYKAFKKQWDVFYRSKFGKVGFYIMVAFVIITLISPLLAHGDPFLAVPAEDYFTPVQVMDSHLNFTPNLNVNITSTLGENSYDYYTFMAGSINGSNYVFAISTNNGNVTQLFKTNGSAISLTAFTPVTTGLVFETYLMAATNHSIYVEQLECTPTHNGATISQLHPQNLTVSGNITKAIVSTGTFYYSRPTNVADQEITQVLSDNPSFINTVSTNKTGTYVNAYYTYGLKELWTHKLSYKPINLYFVGNQFGSDTNARLIVEGLHNTSLMYAINGTIYKSISTKMDNSDMYIPSAYQYSSFSSGFNSSYEISGHSVYKINLLTGNETNIYTASNTILAISSTSGSKGIPSNFLITTSSDNLYSMSYNTSKNMLEITNNIKTPFSVASIDAYSTAGEYLLSNPIHGSMTFLLSSSYPTVNATTWVTNTNKVITSPYILENEYNLKGNGYANAVFISGSNLHMYSLEGVPTVIGPTLHTKSGVALPLGLNSAYNNVFSIYIESFLPDMEVGFIAGILTIFIAVFVAMYIGYYKGMVSAFVETLSLSIFLIPTLPLYIVLATILGPTLNNLILIFALLGWPFVTFSLIGIIRSVKSRTFVDSAIVSNMSTLQIMRRHVLPNMASLLSYLAAVNIGGAVGAISTYEILGLVPLTIPTWGGMLSGFLTNYFILGSEPWVVLPALITITLFILAFIFIARGIDEVANPNLGGR
ncbi:ABC transporter permease [Ferroplasma sp.]|uniref:ABC transporter permease n=1 Tax=Ferroplasma sp. TaxID=2591003 RepID=UPI00307D5BC5